MNNLVVEPDAVLRDFAARVERIGVDYMLTGSMAMLKYATPRFTMDIDIVIDLTAENAGRVIEVLESDYYVPRQAAKLAIARKGMFNAIHQDSAFKIDLVVCKDSEFHQTAFANRRRIEYTDFDVWIISKDDLIVSKLWWAKDSLSEVQMRDVKNLMRTGCGVDYIRSWTEKLGAENLFNQCLREIEQ